MGAVFQDWLSSTGAVSWLCSTGAVSLSSSSTLGAADPGISEPEALKPEANPDAPETNPGAAVTLGPPGAAGAASRWGEGFSGPGVPEASGPRLRALRPVRLQALLSLFGIESVSTISREGFASPLGSTSSSVS